MSRAAIEEILLTEMSRFTIERAVHYVGSNNELFGNLVSIMLSGKSPLPQRAAWAISIITDQQPWLLKPYIEQLTGQICNFEHPALTRCILRYLCVNEIPDNQMGSLLNLCYKYLLDLRTPIAVRVYSMQIIFNISEYEPGLKEELKLTLESLYDTGSSGFQNRAGRLLKQLNAHKTKR